MSVDRSLSRAGRRAGRWTHALALACVWAAGGLHACGRPSVRAPAPPPENLEPAVAELVEAHFGVVRREGPNSANVGRLAMVYEANRLWLPARDAYDLARELEPTNPDWIVHAAHARSELADFDGELALLAEAAPAHATHAPLQFALGEALLDVGDLVPAAQAFERVIQAAPTAPEGYFGKGLVEARRGDPARACPLFERAVALDPTYRRAWYSLGVAQLALGRAEEADISMRRGADAPNRRMHDRINAQLATLAASRDEVLQRAGELVAAGRGGEALQRLERLRRERPEDPLIRFNVATTLTALGRHAEALNEFQAARDADPTLPGIDANLATMLLAAGRAAEALAVAQRAVEREPRVAQSHLVLALALEASGRAPQALEARRRAVDLAPTNSVAQGEFARSLAAGGDLSGAESAFRRQIELAPEDWRAHANLARVLALQGRPDDARRALSAAKRVAGADPAAGGELVALEQGLGR